jgi:hypothetical protein
MQIIKRNKRLYIVDDNGDDVYSPPNFVHIQSRKQLRTLAEAIVAQGYIQAVMDFESKFTRR